MKPLKKCILIKDVSIAAMYSGHDVWLIPYNIETLKFNLKNAYVGDRWYIYNNEIFGYSDELCFIAIEPDDKIGLL
jgi:hypothetical protein